MANAPTNSDKTTNSDRETRLNLVAVAPMMGYTDRHYRYLLRLINANALLFTEMITAKAIIHGDRDQLLADDPATGAVALQIGGSQPAEIYQATQLAQNYNFCEINLNAGCPSPRVQKNFFGAALLYNQELLRDCMGAIASAVAGTSCIASLKCRIAVDEQDPQETLRASLSSARAVGITRVYVHARKAWLEGLSPKDNRTIPPLDLDLVHKVAADFPDLEIIINGGITTLEQATRELNRFDGVMIGRAACHSPELIGEIGVKLMSESSQRGDSGRDSHANEDNYAEIDYSAVIAAYADYADRQMNHAQCGHTALARPLTGMFRGKPGARRFRQMITVGSSKPGESRPEASKPTGTSANETRLHDTGVHGTGVHGTGVHDVSVHGTGVHGTGVSVSAPNSKTTDQHQAKNSPPVNIASLFNAAAKQVIPRQQ